MSLLPSEMVIEILDRLCLRDLIRLGCTCRYYQRITSDHIAVRTKQLFDTFALDQQRLRFLLYHTRSVISGSFVLRLNFPGRSGIFNFRPKAVDIYISKSKADTVLRFLVNTTPYITIVRDNNKDNYMTNEYGLCDSYTLHSTGGSILRVFVSSCSSALAPIFRTHSTLVMGWMSHNAITHAYPNLMFNGVGLLNSQFLSVSTPADNDRSTGLVLKYNIRGAKLIANPARVRHHCGRSSCCPSTVRTTMDSACFNYTFAEPVLGSSDIPDQGRDVSCIIWTRGGYPCGPRGVYVRHFIKVARAVRRPALFGEYLSPSRALTDSLQMRTGCRSRRSLLNPQSAVVVQRQRLSFILRSPQGNYPEVRRSNATVKDLMILSCSMLTSRIEGPLYLHSAIILINIVDLMYPTFACYVIRQTQTSAIRSPPVPF